MSWRTERIIDRAERFQDREEGERLPPEFFECGGGDPEEFDDDFEPEGDEFEPFEPDDCD